MYPRPHCVMKNGLYLAYQKEEVEYYDDDCIEFNGHISGGWYWTNDKDKAHVFRNYEDAKSFLAKCRRSDFWNGAKEIKM